MTSRGRATAGFEAESPTVQGANGLAVFDPALAQRASGMWATIRQGVKLARVVEDRDPPSLDLDRQTPALPHRLRATDCQELGHVFDSLGRLPA